MTGDLHNFLDRPEVMKTLEEILAKYSLLESKAIVYSVLQEIVAGDRSTIEFSDALSDALPDIDPEVIVDLDADVYERLLFPIEDELREAVESKKRALPELLAEIKKTHTLSFAEPRLDERFNRIVEQYVTEEYDRDRTVRSLTKGIKPGGLELSQEVADAIIADLDLWVGKVTFGASAPTVNIVVAPVSIASESVMPVPQALVDTPQEFAAQKLVAALTPPASAPASLVRRTTPDEKQRKTVRQEAQQKSYAKQRVTPAMTAPPASMPQSAKSVTPRIDHMGVLCDVVNEKEMEELLAIQAQMNNEEFGALHDQLKAAFLEVVKKAHVTLPSQDLCERYYQLIITRLKDVRSAYDTRDTVMKSADEGGLGLGVDEAKTFIELLERTRNEFHDTWERVHAAKKQEYVEKKREELFRPAGAVQVAPTPTKQSTSDMVGTQAVTAPKKPEPVVADHLQAAKPSMHDIHAAPELVDPVEELRSYSIEDFHRLSKDAKEAALKIQRKIELLSDWSYGKRYQGIDAWKASEVMRVYREQLQQSLIGDLSLADVIERRKSGDQPFVSTEEVDALTELSNTLRK